MQYPGCSKNAKYGEKDMTPIACQSHKRVGQFTTNRHGELLKATRDGDGETFLATYLNEVPYILRAISIGSCVFCTAALFSGRPIARGRLQFKNSSICLICFYHTLCSFQDTCGFYDEPHSSTH